MAFKTVTVTPSIPAGEYHAADVFFNPTELKLPSRGAKLTSMFIADTDMQLNNETIVFYFFQKNTNNLGTQNATASISVADFRANQFMGVVNSNGTIGGNQLDNLIIRSTDTYYDEDDNNPPPGLELPLNSIESGNAIYVAAILTVVSTNPNFSNEDSVDLIFGFEY